MSHRENKDRRTLYCGNLHEHVTEEMLYELFLQVESLPCPFVYAELDMVRHLLLLVDGSSRNGCN